MIGMVVVFREFARAIRYALRAPEARALLTTTGLVLLGGTLFYMFVEEWSAIDALYFSVVTLATIGYGDLTPTNDASKLFTVFYVLIGIGLVASTVATLASAAIRADAERRARLRAKVDGGDDDAEAHADDIGAGGPLVAGFAARHTRPATTTSRARDEHGTKEEDPA